MSVDPNEMLSRFAVDKAYFRSKDNTAKPKAFMPNGDGETSVFRISGLLEPEKWELGKVNVADPQGKKIRASIEIEAIEILKENLTIDPDDKTQRHATIRNWPEEKSACKLKAIELASKAELHLCPG